MENNIKQEIDKLKKRKDKYVECIYNIDKLLNLYQNRCDHPNTRIQTKYIEGGYLNTSSYEHTTICNICGKFVKVEMEHTNNYV